MIDYVSLGIVLTALTLFAYLMFHLDRKQDARSADTNKKIDELRADVKALENNVDANQDAAVDEIRDAVNKMEFKVDRNTSDIRTEVFRQDERIENRVNDLSKVQVEHGEQIVRLESLSDAERQSASGD